MAFGGFFGGGGSSGSDKDNSSSSTSPNDAPSAQAVFPSAAAAMPSSYSGGSSASSSDIKNRLTNAIATQSNILNAKILIAKINENCFDHCVTSPGSSLSSKESQCLSACMEKYIDGWNTVSKTYVGRLQREGAQLNMAGGAGGL